ncbi:hypothetical protein [uncultured Winogradskyella sp.]|uniref:hypothetical protein n=1 Tax=uncultured Winogradskyella sp. TaxID=395353 RepID=UPI00260219DB|nr:hypothetical protein [uncultured Winogradskyella sp.]
MIDNLRMFILRFIKSKKETPYIAAIAAGLYPILYYFASNFGYVNSIEHIGFFVIAYIGIPLISILILRLIFSKIDTLKAYKGYIISVLNILWFGVLLAINTSGLSRLNSVIILVTTVLLGVFLTKHIKKFIVFQFFLAFVALLYITPKLGALMFQSTDWMQQPDNIEAVVFKNTPNIYLIQPDGYANFSELKRGHYNIDNSEFENYLELQGFTLYNDYRSNYFSTISSNSSLFSMRHHLYNKLIFKTVECYKSRRIIAGNNPVIKIFKNNNYKTSLLLESEYLIANRPKVNYDYQNISFDEMPYLTQGFDIQRNLVDDLKTEMHLNSDTKNFYFIEKIIPSHIAQSRLDNLGKEGERLAYIENLKTANVWLKEMIEAIEKEDPNGLVVIMADHGGFVGMNSIYEAKIKQDDKDLVKSVFTAALAVKWPKKQVPEDLEFKTSVNFFRNLFSYLSDDKRYLDHLQEDASYLAIKKEAPFGVYKAINKDNNVIFDKITD